MGKQSRLKQQRRNTPAKALPKMTQDALQVASQNIDAQALLIAGYQQELERLQPIVALLPALLECQTIEQVHTTLQRALDSGLLPSGEEPHE